MSRKPKTPQAVVTRLRTLLRTAPQGRASLVDQEGVWFSVPRLRELLVEDWPAAESLVGLHMVEAVLQLLRRQGSAYRCRFYDRGAGAVPRWSHSNGGNLLCKTDGLWRWPMRDEALDAWRAEKARAALEGAGIMAGMTLEERSRWCVDWCQGRTDELDRLFGLIWRPATHGDEVAHAQA